MITSAFDSVAMIVGHWISVACHSAYTNAKFIRQIYILRLWIVTMIVGIMLCIIRRDSQCILSCRVSWYRIVHISCRSESLYENQHCNIQTCIIQTCTIKTMESCTDVRCTPKCDIKHNPLRVFNTNRCECHMNFQWHAKVAMRFIYEK